MTTRVEVFAGEGALLVRLLTVLWLVSLMRLLRLMQLLEDVVEGRLTRLG